MRTRDPEKENAIREEAFSLFFKEGFEGFSMGKLAKAAGVSPATLYIYYKDKDDLILQLYKEEMQKMTDAALVGFDPTMRFAEGLRTQWMNRAHYAMAHPIESHFLEQVRFTPFHDQALKCTDSSFIAAMRSFVMNAIERKELVQIPVEVFWSVAYAPLYQLLKYHIHGYSFPGMRKFKFDEKTMLLTLDLVLKALKPQEKK